MIKTYCFIVAITVILGGLAHGAALIGGKDWLVFLHAPPKLVEAYEQGALWPHLLTLAIMAALLIAAAYLLGAVGIGPRLWLMVPALITLSLIFIGRGLILIPLILLDKKWLIAADTFGIVSSALCVFMGSGFVVGLLCQMGWLRAD